MIPTSSRNVVLALALSALLAGCATKSELETVQNQAYRDRQESRRTIQQLEEQLAQSQNDLRDEIQKSTSPVQAKQANTWAELESVRVQIAKIQERLDTLTVRFNAMTNATSGGPNLVDVASDVQNIKTALQSQFGMNLDGPAGAAPAHTAKSEPEAKPAGKAEAAKPAKADAAFKAKKYEEARQYYSEFATNFKKHANTSNAVFFVGECAFHLQDYGKAVLAYQEVIEKYPKSSKNKAAVLKQGMAFFKIGKDKAGRAVMQDLIDRFPSSPEAISAKKFLKEHK
jgi:tol-pal system protein YbgF